MNLHRDTSRAIEPNTSFNTTRQEWSPAQRKTWSEKNLAARLELPALSLGERGLIMDCNKPLLMLFGFRRSDLVWQQVSRLFPQLGGVELVQAGHVNPLLNYFCRCGRLYQSQTRLGDTFSSNLSIVRLEYKGRRTFRMIVRPEVL
ncbi:MAG: hypothetical protein Q8L69_07205 [Gallionellaceae bacterium]|nr:hypothetical protein [Gallionellaceae bacterium]